MKHTLLFLLTFILLHLPAEGKAKLPPNSSTFFQPEVALYFKLGTLHIEGFDGAGTIQIYSIIGNLIHHAEVQEFRNFKLPIHLEDKQMYIIRIETEAQKKTFKIVTS